MRVGSRFSRRQAEAKARARPQRSCAFLARCPRAVVRARPGDEHRHGAGRRGGGAVCRPAPASLREEPVGQRLLLAKRATNRPSRGRRQVLGIRAPVVCGGAARLLPGLRGGGLGAGAPCDGGRPRRKTAYRRGPAGPRRGADERPDTQPPLPLPSLHRGDRGPAPRGRPRRALSGLRHRIRPGALGSGWPHRLADTRVLRPRAASSRVLLEREAAGTLAAARAWIGDAEALDDHRKRAELRYGRVDFGPTPGHREHTRRELDG